MLQRDRSLMVKEIMRNEELRARISASLKGRKRSVETRKRMSDNICLQRWPKS